MTTDNKNFKVEIAYRPKLDDEEKVILETVFGKDHLVLGEYITKGVLGASFDVQIIIFIKAVAIIIPAEILAKMIVNFITKLFNRNRACKFYGGRPRRTLVVIQKQKTQVTVSNINEENKLTITQSKVNHKSITTDYSPEELKKLLDEKE